MKKFLLFILCLILISGTVDFVTTIKSFSDTSDYWKEHFLRLFSNNKIIRLEDYGAIGDGSHEETTSFYNAQAAIVDNSSLELYNKKYIVSAHGGSYVISDKKNIVIDGHGGSLNMLSGSTNYNQPFITLSNCDSVIIKNITFNGRLQESAWSNQAIICTGCNNVLIDNVTGSNCLAGITLTNCNKCHIRRFIQNRSIVTGVKAIDSIAYGAGKLGGQSIYINGTGSDYTIDDCYGSGVFGGILFQPGTSNARVLNNTYKYTFNTAIYGECNGIVMSGNILDHPGKDGIKNTQVGSMNAILFGNIITGAGWYDAAGGAGIGATGTNTTIFGNQVYIIRRDQVSTSFAYGIFSYCDAVKIYGNLVKYIGDSVHRNYSEMAGILISARSAGGGAGNCNSSSITDNDVYNTQIGIYFTCRDGYINRNGSINNNHLFGTFLFGIRIIGSISTTITNVIAKDNDIHNFYSWGIYTDYINNIIISNNSFYNQLGITNNNERSITANTSACTIALIDNISDGTDYGLFVTQPNSYIENNKRLINGTYQIITQ